MADRMIKPIAFSFFVALLRRSALRLIPSWPDLRQHPVSYQ
jgi:hypothetical protein